MRLYALCCVALQALLVCCTELTFELPENDEQCFFDDFAQDEKFIMDFQVIAGGGYDVDYYITDPKGDVLYHGQKSQYEEIAHIVKTSGAHKTCFNNEFSTFTHKIVYMSWRRDKEEPLLPEMAKSTAMTQIESTCVAIHEILKVVAESQTFFRLREAHDRIQAEDLHERVTYWSLGETVLLFAVGLGQVLLLKSFFSDKKGTVAATT